jgi:hypothetical protein
MPLQISVIDLKGGRYRIGDAIEGARDWWVSPSALYLSGKRFGSAVFSDINPTLSLSKNMVKQHPPFLDNDSREQIKLSFGSLLEG